jgi:hypothetical protein
MKIAGPANRQPGAQTRRRRHHSRLCSLPSCKPGLRRSAGDVGTSRPSDNCEPIASAALRDCAVLSLALRIKTGAHQRGSSWLRTALLRRYRPKESP